MKLGVPTIWPVAVTSESMVVALARPKSVILGKDEG